MTDERKKEIQAKIAEIGENEEFYKGLARCESVEQCSDYLVKNGISVTNDEVVELQKIGESALKAMKDNSSGELSAEELDNVAGGGFWRGVISVVGGVFVGAAGGVICGLAPAATPFVYKVATAYAIGATAWTISD